MKCDELTPIELECNMGKDINGVVNREPWKAYDIDEVDTLLDKKNSEINELRDECQELHNRVATLLSQIRIRDERIDELDAKLESVQATAYADSVDAGMRERRLNRALWLARTYRAEARKNYWYARSCHEGDKYMWAIDGSAVKYIGCIKRSNFDWLKVWSEVESKCRAKAEEYK